MMHWFGRDPWAPLCDDCPKVATPVGHPCGWCTEPIRDGDDGVFIDSLAFHYECNLRQIIGGLNHLMGICSCCGGAAEPDPPELSKRQAAQAAIAYWTERNRP